MDSSDRVFSLVLLLIACQTVLACDVAQATACLSQEDVCSKIESTDSCLTTNLEGCGVTIANLGKTQWDRIQSDCNMLNPNMPCSHPKLQECLTIMSRSNETPNPSEMCKKMMEVSNCLKNFTSECEDGQPLKNMAQELLTNLTIYSEYCQIMTATDMPCSYPKFQECGSIMNIINEPPMSRPSDTCKTVMEISDCLNNFTSQCEDGHLLKNLSQEVVTTWTMFTEYCQMVDTDDSCYLPAECWTYMAYSPTTSEDVKCNMMKQAFSCFSDFRSQCKKAQQNTSIDNIINMLDMYMAACDSFNSTERFCTTDMSTQCIQGFTVLDFQTPNFQRYCGIHWGTKVCLEAVIAVCADDSAFTEDIRSSILPQITNYDTSCAGMTFENVTCNITHVKDCYTDLFSNITGGQPKIGICKNVNQTIECLQNLNNGCTNDKIVPAIEQNIVTLQSYSRLCADLWDYDICIQGLNECKYNDHVETISSIDYISGIDYMNYTDSPISTKHMCRDPMGGKQCLQMAHDQCRNTAVKAAFAEQIIARMDELFLPCGDVMSIETCQHSVRNCDLLKSNVTSMETPQMESNPSKTCRTATLSQECLQGAQATCGYAPINLTISWSLTLLSQIHQVCKDMRDDSDDDEDGDDDGDDDGDTAVTMSATMETTSGDDGDDGGDDDDGGDVGDDDGALKTSGYPICLLVLTALVARALP